MGAKLTVTVPRILGCHHDSTMDAHNGTPYPRTNFSAGAKWIKNLTRDRLNNFNGGHFSDVNLSAVMFIHRIDNEEHVKLEVYVS